MARFVRSRKRRQYHHVKESQADDRSRKQPARFLPVYPEYSGKNCQKHDPQPQNPNIKKTHGLVFRRRNGVNHIVIRLYEDDEKKKDCGRRHPQTALSRNLFCSLKISLLSDFNSICVHRAFLPSYPDRFPRPFCSHLLFCLHLPFCLHLLFCRAPSAGSAPSPCFPAVRS